MSTVEVRNESIAYYEHSKTCSWQEECARHLQQVVHWKQIKLWGTRIKLSVEITIRSDFREKNSSNVSLYHYNIRT